MRQYWIGAERGAEGGGAGCPAESGPHGAMIAQPFVFCLPSGRDWDCFGVGGPPSCIKYGAGGGLKKADLQELPVLDLRRLTPTQLQGLSDLFDRLSEAEFERLPGMGGCPARRALDDGVSEILDLPDLGKLRELLASEPAVSNRRL